MNRKTAKRLGWVIFGLAVCLTAPACRTCGNAERDMDTVSTHPSADSEVLQKLRMIVIPEMTFRPPASIIDAVAFFTEASREHDDPNIPAERRGVNFMLRLPHAFIEGHCHTHTPFEMATCTNRVASPIPALSARFINLYDALKLTCDVTGMKMVVRGDVVWIEPVDEEYDELPTRVFDLHASHRDMFCRIRVNDCDQTENPRAYNWQALFEQLGASWPKGSFAVHLAKADKLFVRNTAKNLNAIEQTLDDLLVLPRHQINIEVEIVAFKLQDIEKLMIREGMSLSSLTALRKGGKAKLVSTASVITTDGQEATVKSVQGIPCHAEPDGNEVGDHNFAVQEIGMILQVLPRIWMDGKSIDLLLNPQWVTLNRWETLPATRADVRFPSATSFRQPIFETTHFQAPTTVTDGEAVLLGSCTMPDGEWVHCGFLTATLSDIQSDDIIPESRTCETVERDTNAPSPGDTGNRKERRGGLAPRASGINAMRTKLHEIIIPEMSFRSPDTIIDAVDFFTKASRDYDDPKIPPERRGVTFTLHLPCDSAMPDDDPFSGCISFAICTNCVAPTIPAISARFISLHDALKLVCDVTGMKIFFARSNNSIFVVPDYGDDDFLTQSFNLPFPSCDVEEHAPVLIETQTSPGDELGEWKPIFDSMGITWPTGSSVHHLAVIGKLRVTNYRRNLDLIAQVLDALTATSRQVNVTVETVAFKMRDIEKLTRNERVSLTGLTALRKAGKAKPVSVAHVETRDGQAAATKATQQMIWPLEPDWREAKNANLATQEVGMVLQVLPEIRPNSKWICLSLDQQWTAFKRWEKYLTEPSEKTFRQPVFETTTFQTQAMGKSGELILLGGCSTPDGKWVYYSFLTATLLESQNTPPNKNAFERPLLKTEPEP